MIEYAANVHWGDWVIYKDEIQVIDDPESLTSLKEWLDNLSSEGKQLLNLVTNLPDEMFTAGGKVLKNEVFKILREKNWKFKTIKQAWEELKGWL